jgi:hypothetical protein
VRGFAAVFGREVSERRMLALLALGLGLVPLAAPWMPGVGRENTAELRSAMALALGLVLSAVTAILLGGSVISRDLAERRLGFYFSRPLAGWEIWAGKLGAAVALTLGSALLVLLPTALLGGVPGPQSLGVPVAATPWLFLGLGILLIELILLSHAGGVVLRARSPWVALDLAAAAVFAILGWDAFRRLLFVGALIPAQWVPEALALLMLAGLLAAGAVQVIAGRTDPRRAHRVLSLTLWGVLLASGLAAQGYARWVLAAAPEDLGLVSDVKASPGSWIGVCGWDTRRRFEPCFLVDVPTGRFVRARTVQLVGAPGLAVSFSPDGRWAAWLEPEEGAGRPGPVQLYRLDLRHPEAGPFQSTVAYGRAPSTFVLSPDGSRIAAILDGRVLVDEIVTGNRLVAAPLPDSDVWPLLQFVSPGRLQLRGAEIRRPEMAPAIWKIWGMDIAQGHFGRTGGFEALRSAAKWSADGSRAAMFDPRTQEIQLLDGWTGQPFARLPWQGAAPGVLGFLADGGIAVEVPGGGETELRILAPDLSGELRRGHIQGASRLRLVGQPAPDHLTVSAETLLKRRGRRLLLLDLATGSLREMPADLGPVTSVEGPGSAGSRLFTGIGGRLLQLDPGTGGLRPVLGAKAAR